jgi:hypothetical protein
LLLINTPNVAFATGKRLAPLLALKAAAATLLAPCVAAAAAAAIAALAAQRAAAPGARLPPPCGFRPLLGRRRDWAPGPARAHLGTQP